MYLKQLTEVDCTPTFSMLLSSFQLQVGIADAHLGQLCATYQLSTYVTYIIVSSTPSWRANVKYLKVFEVEFLARFLSSELADFWDLMFTR